MIRQTFSCHQEKSLYPPFKKQTPYSQIVTLMIHDDCNDIGLSALYFQTKIGHVTYHRLPTAPSIPMPGQNYGYDEDGDGVLKPQKLPSKDSTIGPAYYNVRHVRRSRL